MDTSLTPLQHPSMWPTRATLAVFYSLDPIHVPWLVSPGWVHCFKLRARRHAFVSLFPVSPFIKYMAPNKTSPSTQPTPHCQLVNLSTVIFLPGCPGLSVSLLHYIFPQACLIRTTRAATVCDYLPTCCHYCTVPTADTDASSPCHIYNWLRESHHSLIHRLWSTVLHLCTVG